MKKTILSVILAGAASAASAGGFSTPVVEVAPVAVTPVVQAGGDWQGAYGGVALGYATGGDDRFGYNTVELGKHEISGINGTLRAGYRWQRGKWVVGPEVSATFGNISDSFTAGGTEITSRVDNTLALKLKTGYEVQPNMLVFGIAGVTSGNFTIQADGFDDADYTASGYVFGLGLERKITDRMSVTGEIERNLFKKEEVTVLGGGVTYASPSFTNVKVGVNFKF